MSSSSARSSGGESLRKYRQKRDFTRTPEPEGAQPADGSGRAFVVQRHRARRLHYDFRLEVDGVLASWAMPKGPPLDPSVRALAVHVEDHPIEYRDFEGVIPKGEYGGGDVIVWDRGEWFPARTDDPGQAIADGELHFDLQGVKLKGRFVLVRTRTQRGQEQWLMLHKHDDFARPGWTPEDHRQSVKSGRTNEEVAEAPDALWRSDLPAAEAEVRVDRKAGADQAARSGPSRSGPSRSSPSRSSPSRSGPSWSGPTDDELRALDALGSGGGWYFDGEELRLTNLDKVLFPGRDGDPPVTKRDLVRYHASVAPAMLRYLANRPVNLHRYPNGVDEKGFWHKAAPSHAPDWITRWHNEDAERGESEYYFVVDRPAALAWMANYAAVELHPWTSQLPYVRSPTWALIDIDPGPETGFDEVVLLARLFHAALDHLGVFGLPKLTGRRGMHIWIPIRPGYSFDDTRAWTEKVSRAVGATVPELISWEWEKSRRQGRARLDYTQNAINKTLVAPYSVRAAPGAPCSAPISWADLDDNGLRSDMYTVRTLPDRLSEVGDLFEPLLGRAQSLPDL